MFILHLTGVHITVLNEKNEPLPIATYATDDMTGSYPVSSDGTFLRVLKQGGYVIQIQAKGYESLSKQVNAKSDVITEVKIQLTKEPAFLQYHSHSELKAVLDRVHKKCPDMTRLYR